MQEKSDFVKHQSMYNFFKRTKIKLKFKYEKVYNYFGFNIRDLKLDDELKTILINDLNLCLFFTYKTRLRVEFCEELIAKNAKYSYLYSINIGCNSYYGENKDFLFKAGEPAILQCPLYSSLYAHNVLRKKWPEAEKIISTSSEASYIYARLTRKRFELGEEAISKNVRYSFEYSNIIYERFILGESKILNSSYARQYCMMFKLKLTPEIEKIIAKSARESVNYACQIGRFEPGEKSISKSSNHSLIYAISILKSRFKLGENAILKNEKTFKKYVEYFLDKKEYKEATRIINKKLELYG